MSKSTAALIFMLVSSLFVFPAQAQERMGADVTLLDLSAEKLRRLPEGFRPPMRTCSRIYQHYRQRADEPFPGT